MLSLLLRTIRTERLRSTTLYIKNKSHANIFTRQKNLSHTDTNDGAD